MPLVTNRFNKNKPYLINVFSQQYTVLMAKNVPNLEDIQCYGLQITKYLVVVKNFYGDPWFARVHS